jgi:hypothetical protein
MAQDTLFIQQHPSDIRVLTGDGGSGAEYVADMLNAVVARLEPDIGPALQARAAASLPLFDAPPQSALLDQVPEPVRREVLRRLEGLNAFMGDTFVVPHDPAVKSWISWADIDYPAGRKPSLIWVRKGQTGMLQIVLGNLDALGLLEALERELAPGHESMHLHVQVKTSAKEVLSTITDLSLSVSWALPPPWGAAATLGLSMFKMFMGAGDERPNPWQDLADGIKEFERQLQIENYSSDFSDFAEQLSTKTATMHANVSELKENARYLDDLHDWLYGSYGFGMVHNRLTHIYDNYLSVRDLKGCRDILPLFVSGATLYMTGRKLEMQIIACRAFAAKGVDDDKFFSYASEWKRIFHELRLDMLGDADNCIMGYFEKVSAQIERIGNERLSKLSAPVRQEREGHWDGVAAGGAGAGVYYKVTQEAGWKVHDGSKQHFVADTHDSDGWHNHKAQAVALYKAGEKTAADEIGGITGQPTKLARAWKQKLDEVQNMMPPSAPAEKPSVKPLAHGDAVPQGGWEAGKKVCYAVNLKNNKGPSDLGPWSDPMEIGATAFAEVTVSSEVTSQPDTIAWITRRFIDETGMDEKKRIVGATRSGQTTYEDKHK